MGLDENQIPTVSDLEGLALATQAAFKQPINEITAMSGTTAATTFTYMQYAYNVISNATTTNYAARLPNPPTKGRSCTIINTSSVPIVIYPSVTGGSINGVVNGSALIPNDGKPYEFFCYENPLPGAWTWTPPATNQYDSGEITVIAQGSSNVITAANASFVGRANGTTTPFGETKGALFQSYAPTPNTGTQVQFKPSTLWNTITKVKVYTNATAVSPNARIIAQSGYFYYEKNTSNLLYSEQVQAYNPFISITGTWSSISGSAISSPVSTNIGDPATFYSENTNSLVVPIPPHIYGDSIPQSKATAFGDYYMGDQVIDGVLCEQWYTQYLVFAIVPNASITTGSIYKFRFFIEYN